MMPERVARSGYFQRRVTRRYTGLLLYVAWLPQYEVCSRSWNRSGGYLPTKGEAG